MIYVNLVGFGLLLAASVYFLVLTIRQDRRTFYKDAEFYGFAMYALAALSYFQAVVRVLADFPVGIAEQRSINLIMLFALIWSVSFAAIRKGFLDNAIDKMV